MGQFEMLPQYDEEALHCTQMDTVVIDIPLAAVAKATPQQNTGAEQQQQQHHVEATFIPQTATATQPRRSDMPPYRVPRGRG